MKRLVLLCALMVCFAGVASAQDDMSKTRRFRGIFLRSPEFRWLWNQLQRWQRASGAYNVNPWLGIVADFGGYHTGTDGISGNLFSTIFWASDQLLHMGKMIAFRSGSVRRRASYRWRYSCSVSHGFAHASGQIGMR